MLLRLWCVTGQLSALMSKGSAEVDAARLLPKLVDLVHDSMLQTATASEAMDHRRMTQEMTVLNKRVEEAGASLCGCGSAFL